MAGRYGTVEAVQARINEVAAQLQGMNPGAANDLRGFLNGTMPVTPQAQSALQAILAESPFAGNPQGFQAASRQLGVDTQGRNTPEDRTGMTGYPGAPPVASPTPAAPVPPPPTQAPGAATAAFVNAATGGGGGTSPLNLYGQTGQASGAPQPAPALVDEFGAQTQGGYQSQRPTEAGINYSVQAAKAQAATAAQKAKAAVANGSGGGATPGAGSGGFLSEVERALAADDPGYAIAAIRAAKTGGQRDRSMAGAQREGMLGSALRAFLAMQMPNSDGSFVGDPVGQANQGLADIVAGATGGGFGGVLRGQAANMLGQDFSGMDDLQIMKMLSAAGDASTFGYGDFAGYGVQNQLADLENRARQNVMGGGSTAILAQPESLNAFQQLLQQYLGTGTK